MKELLFGDDGIANLCTFYSNYAGSSDGWNPPSPYADYAYDEEKEAWFPPKKSKKKKAAF